MSLTHDLVDQQQRSRANASLENRSIMDRATDDLEHSGIVDRSLKIGDTMPGFALSNATGRMVQSVDLLAHGPLVVSFYRGGW